MDREEYIEDQVNSVWVKKGFKRVAGWKPARIPRLEIHMQLIQQCPKYSVDLYSVDLQLVFR